MKCSKRTCTREAIEGRKRCLPCTERKREGKRQKRAKQKGSYSDGRGRGAVSTGRNPEHALQQAREVDGAGPLADSMWRRHALWAIETWVRFGTAGWTAPEWCEWARRTERHHQRTLVAWEACLGLRVERPPIGCLGSDPPRYTFTPEAVDRLRLIDDLLTRFLEWLPPLEKDPPCESA